MNWEEYEGTCRCLIKVLSRHLPGETEENHVVLRIVVAPSGIRTENLSNTSPNRYHLSQLALFPALSSLERTY
jgi:hypothetical protein